jgi:hypothetical protein
VLPSGGRGATEQPTLEEIQAGPFDVLRADGVPLTGKERELEGLPQRAQPISQRQGLAYRDGFVALAV